MLHFPLWKKLAILGICLLGLGIAFPNLFYDRVERSNDARALLETGAAETPELASARALWPGFLPSGLVNLGLDLRGGAHVLVEVALEDVHAQRLEGLWPELRDRLRDARDTVGTVRRLEGGTDALRIRIGSPEGMEDAIAAVRAASQPVFSLTGAASRDFEASAEAPDVLAVTLSEAEKQLADERTIQQSLEIIRRRVDETGTREPTIQRQGAERILIQVPGIGSAEELLAIIGQTARLSFHPVQSRTTDAPVETFDTLVVPALDEPGVSYVLDRSAVVSGEQLVDSQPSFDQNGQPAVTFRFNAAGGAAFGAYTAQNIGEPFAIVLDDEVISAPVIQSHIPGGSGIITGNFTPEESTRLAILLRAGALPAEIRVLEQRTVGPELGQDSIDAGRIAAIVAMAAVLGFMIAVYGFFGFIANVTLVVNIGLVFALLTLVGATLTLPGIAGLVLTIGMAVDANVLIFERIREELRTARGPARAIEQGFDKALSAILDANITTLIAAVILFALGSGPVRGFAVTLGLGIITSVFTAVYVTRLMIVIWFERRKPRHITI